MSKLQTKAYELVKARIVDGTYDAATVIDDKKIAEEIGSSRTPVREALILLANEGYVEILPKRGVVIRPFTVENAMEIFEVRALLEPWLLRNYGPLFTREELLAERALIEEESKQLHNQKYLFPGIAMDHRPHTTLLEKCNNRYIFEMMKRIEQQSCRIPNVRTVLSPPREPTDAWVDLISRAHTQIVDLMLEKKFDEAAQLAAEHVATGRREYLKFWFNQ